MSDMIITIEQSPPIVVVLTNPSATMDVAISSGLPGVPGPPGESGLTDAFIDGKSYVRKDGEWVLETVYTHPATHSPSIIEQDVTNRFVSDAEKGAWSGKADLVGGVVPAAQLPAYHDEIVWVDTASNLPVIGAENIVYITKDTNAELRWSGTAYSEISPSVSIGETSSTAFRGDQGKVAYDHSQAEHAPATAEQNVQSDWTQVDTGANDFIKNVPLTFPPAGHTHADYEPNLGNPVSDGLVLSSTAAGVREWVMQSSGGSGRTLLTTDTTYYVATTGSDSNDGSISTPFLTAQKAYDFICSSLDLGGRVVTIKMADGTYAAGITALQAPVGGSSVVFNGNSTTPSNVVMTGNMCAVLAGVQITVTNMKSTTTSGATLTSAHAAGKLIYSGITFGGTNGNSQQISVYNAGYAEMNGPCTLSGLTANHAWVARHGYLYIASSLTFQNSPNYVNGFFVVAAGALVVVRTFSFSGTVSGLKYNVVTNAVIDSGGATLPGTTTVTGTGGVVT